MRSDRRHGRRNRAAYKAFGLRQRFDMSRGCSKPRRERRHEAEVLGNESGKRTHQWLTKERKKVTSTARLTSGL